MRERLWMREALWQISASPGRQKGEVFNTPWHQWHPPKGGMKDLPTPCSKGHHHGATSWAADSQSSTCRTKQQQHKTSEAAGTALSLRMGWFQCSHCHVCSLEVCSYVRGYLSPQCSSTCHKACGKQCAMGAVCSLHHRISISILSLPYNMQFQQILCTNTPQIAPEGQLDK